MDRIHDFIQNRVELFRQDLGASLTAEFEKLRTSRACLSRVPGLVPDLGRDIKAPQFSISSLLSSIPR
jgi:hypothetical protein